MSVGASNGSGPDDRGLTPQVGLVLLIGLVIVGATLVVATGWLLIDSLESESQAELTRSTVEVTDHGIVTATTTGQTQTIPWEDASYSDDGQVQLVWHNGSVTGANEAVTIETLGAIEYELSDRTIAYQSGASWEKRDGETQVLSSPTVGYDDEILQLHFTTLDREAVSGTEAVVEPEQNSTRAGAIENASTEAADAGFNDLTIVVESDYYDGWQTHFESVFGTANVTATEADDEVEVTLENATETDPPAFLVTADNGVANDASPGTNRFVDRADTPLNVSAVVKNSGDEQDSQNVTLTLPDANESVEPDPKYVTRSGGEEAAVNLSIPPGNRDDLEHGERYEYTVATEDDELEDPGTFYYAKQEEPYLNVSNLTVDGEKAMDSTDPVNATAENVTLEAAVHNLGVENVSESKLELELESEAADWTGTNASAIDRTFGENATASWTFNRSLLPQGELTATVDADEGDKETGYINVDDGIDPDSDEVNVPSNTEVNVSIVGAEMSNSNPYECSNCREAYVPDRTDGSFTTDGDGMTYSFDGPSPDGPDDELEKSDDGGWVSPNGTEPTANCDSSGPGACEWTWDVDELVWDESQGYELVWEPETGGWFTDPGEWAWDGPIKAGSAPNDELELLVDSYEIQWLPARADIVIQPVNETNDPTGEPETIETDWSETNLNQFDEPRPIYDHNFTTDERVSLMIDAASYTHGTRSFCGAYGEQTVTDTYDGSVYDHIECTDEAVSGGGELVDLTADTETNETNVRVLGEEDTTIPELDPGVDRQEPVDDLLERPGVDVPVDESGELNLSENEFVFAFTLTHHPEQHNQNPDLPQGGAITPDEYWEAAHDSAGDPNFNDMIAHVEITPGSGTAGEDPGLEIVAVDDESGSITPIETGSGSSPDQTGYDPDQVDVRSDEIIIG
ncbi:DUF7289 family protein [Natronobacterium gregoryi]|uniref:Flagellin n=2 Tax=Natronobacterium gregoryi TaxID=44930 RepID=L0AE29_NATGS|nr:hypothetical protein [Natronobacterium gregoryi]AFZ71407.1 hypothetical protein Natgr_0142 [Natronobacterium gregoryi SP2]ELY66932.1 flagellin domain protein [Natronobacterium gregoryi SP2]PLK21214.1 flagellin [Natronobacterium gregoryi SP2]SFI84461.1 hypothetical protein SAMN05443661_10727 [Natronobacterium gregoryi]